MKRIYVVTEGHSETNFVNKVLAPYFLEYGKILIPTTVLTKVDAQKGRMYKGGMRTYAKARLTIEKNLSSIKDSNTFVTTMFDFYALPSDTPGYKDSESITDPYEKVSCIEKAMGDYETLTNNVYFPYIQLHEFEALLFSNLDILSESYFEYDIKPLRACLEEKKNPELINDGPETAPSKRIMRCIPDYDKATMGVSVLEKIGVEALCQTCRHFSEWIDKLKAV
ncbi:MAG: DUF4276 family protein [Treponema sp.]|nr:DUF4276 family protein [Treponema sp.]